MAETSSEDLSAEQQRTGKALARAAAIMERLRGPGGCPWDREQTFDSIKRHTLEETYEVFDAIERRAWSELRDELGDLLLQVLFYAQMAAEAGYFTLDDVAEALSAKLIRRHPHVFGNAVADDAQAVVRTWESVKREEKKGVSSDPKTASALDGVPRSMPALQEASKLGSKAAKVGFDWPDPSGLFEKLAEETEELRTEMASGNQEALELELGDLLFTVANLARHVQVDPEIALRRSSAKFSKRFRTMEAIAGGAGAFEDLATERKEELWKEAKLANPNARQRQ